MKKLVILTVVSLGIVSTISAGDLFQEMQHQMQAQQAAVFAQQQAFQAEQQRQIAEACRLAHEASFGFLGGVQTYGYPDLHTALADREFQKRALAARKK